MYDGSMQRTSFLPFVQPHGRFLLDDSLLRRFVTSRTPLTLTDHCLIYIKASEAVLKDIKPENGNCNVGHVSLFQMLRYFSSMHMD
jgi:hypothetical protein